MDVRPATLEEVKYVEHLHRVNAEFLGMIPRQAYELAVENRHGSLLVAVENGDLVGYNYFGVRAGLLTHHQVAVQDDARRLEVGTALVTAAEARSRARISGCKVRDTIPAHDFWPALGFEPIGTTPAGRRGEELIVYRRSLTPMLLPFSWA